MQQITDDEVNCEIKLEEIKGDDTECDKKTTMATPVSQDSFKKKDLFFGSMRLKNNIVKLRYTPTPDSESQLSFKGQKRILGNNSGLSSKNYN